MTSANRDDRGVAVELFSSLAVWLIPVAFGIATPFLVNEVCVDV